VTDFDEFEREGWDSGRAGLYHHGLGAITSRPIPELLDAAGVVGGAFVLDVATGPGYAAGLSVARGATVTAVDRSEGMLSLAASLHPEVSFVRADAAALPFEDAAFDAVVSNLLMPHVSDLPAVVAELARVVRPGGRVALTTWDPEPETFLRALIEAIAEGGAVPPPDLPAGPPFFQYAADDEFRALLLGAGLEDPVVRSVPFTHAFGDLDAFWAELMSGTVRSSAMILAQTDDVQARIRHTYGAKLDRWRRGTTYEVACAIKVGAATRSRNTRA
jgi:SAM-dependent methyltransferase